MNLFFIKKEKNSHGSYEIHRDICLFINSSMPSILLGRFRNTKDALDMALNKYSRGDIDLCYFCSKDIFN